MARYEPTDGSGVIGGLGRVALRLALSGRDEARTANVPRADHAAGVEVVALVPAVVRDLVALVRLDHGEQERAERMVRSFARARRCRW